MVTTSALSTTLTAGTGNNLTAANYVMFLGLPWTIGIQEQAEDRAYLNGQSMGSLLSRKAAFDSECSTW